MVVVYEKTWWLHHIVALGLDRQVSLPSQWKRKCRSSPCPVSYIIPFILSDRLPQTHEKEVPSIKNMRRKALQMMNWHNCFLCPNFLYEQNVWALIQENYLKNKQAEWCTFRADFIYEAPFGYTITLVAMRGIWPRLARYFNVIHMSFSNRERRKSKIKMKHSKNPVNFATNTLRHVTYHAIQPKPVK